MVSVPFINLILAFLGCIIVLSSIILSGRFSRRIQRIEIEKLGIKLDVDAVTLFVVVGLIVVFIGFYFYNQDIKNMSSEINRLKKLVNNLKQSSTVLNCEFTIEHSSDFVHDDSVKYFFYIKDKEIGTKSELKPLTVWEEPVFYRQGDNIKIRRVELILL